ISDVASEAGGDEGGDFSDFGSDETIAGSEGTDGSPAEDIDAQASSGEAAPAENTDEFGDLESTDQQAAAPTETNDDPFADSGVAGTTEESADPFADSGTSSTDPIAESTDSGLTDTTSADTTAPSDDLATSSSASEEPIYTEAPARASLKKMAVTPYTKAG